MPEVYRENRCSNPTPTPCVDEETRQAVIDHIPSTITAATPIPNIAIAPPTPPVGAAPDPLVVVDAAPLPFPADAALGPPVFLLGVGPLLFGVAPLELAGPSPPAFLLVAAAPELRGMNPGAAEEETMAVVEEGLLTPPTGNVRFSKVLRLLACALTAVVARSRRARLVREWKCILNCV